MWVVNPNYIRKDLNTLLDAATKDTAKLKAAAEQRMALYDKLPRAARDTVKEYGQLNSAIICRSRRAVDISKAVRKAYQRKLERGAIQI